MARRLWIAHTSADLVSMSVFTLGGVFLIWYELWHILPTYYPTPCVASYTHQIIMAFLAAQIYSNMFLLSTTDARVKNVSLDATNRSCDICSVISPPRSHHCKICNTCVEKRDHHCWFAGTCVGQRNHRYYVVMVVYMFLAALYCNMFNFRFVMAVKGTMGFVNLVTFVLPHVALMFGYYGLYTFAITTLSLIGFMLLVMFGWMLQIQVAQLYSGQTRYERRVGLPGLDRGIRNNIRDVIGRRYIRNVLLPFSNAGVGYSSLFNNNKSM